MRTNSINNNKVNENNMTKYKNLEKFYAKQLRKDCKKLISIVSNDRNEDGIFLTFADIAAKKEFILAYRKAKFHFNQLVKAGENGKRLANIIFGKEAYESAEFRCTEDYYLKKHPEDKGFFNTFDYYKLTRKRSSEEKIQDKIAAENSAREEKRVKAVRETGHRNRKIAAIVIVAIIAVAAFAVAVYKKGLKPVCKAIAFGGCCVAVIFAFRKAQDAVLERIHKRFYGNK